MAPPPPASKPLTERLLILAQTLQFGWFIGHLTLLFCTFRYGLSYITFNYYSSWARFSYRTAFVAAAATYGIVVYKGARARSKNRQAVRPLTLAGDENVQYLLMAVVWLLSSCQIPLALLPFTVYSVFHVATYTRTNLIPTLQPPPAGAASPGGRPKASPLAERISKFVKEHYDSSMMLVASLEILLWFRVVLSAIIFTRGSWILFFFYSVFVRARYAQSAFVQEAIHQGTHRIDAMVADQNLPPQVRQLWGTIKAVAKQATDATDLNRYIQGQPQGKKPQ